MTATPLFDAAQSQPDRLASYPIPDRKTDHVTLMRAFLEDCASAEGYGHDLPSDVVSRAARILSLGKPKPSGIGYTEPPPARCAACDSQ